MGTKPSRACGPPGPTLITAHCRHLVRVNSPLATAGSDIITDYPIHARNGPAREVVRALGRKDRRLRK